MLTCPSIGHSLCYQSQEDLDAHVCPLRLQNKMFAEDSEGEKGQWY